MTDEATQGITPEPADGQSPRSAKSAARPSRTTLMMLGGVGAALLVGLTAFAVGSAFAENDEGGDRGDR